MAISVGPNQYTALLPVALRRAGEFVSGICLGDVRVHYDSEKPGELGFAAFAQGRNIYLAPEQQMHLPHELWHVIQQISGIAEIPDELMHQQVLFREDLEREADVMGAYLSEFSEFIAEDKKVKAGEI